LATIISLVVAVGVGVVSVFVLHWTWPAILMALSFFQLYSRLQAGGRAKPTGKPVPARPRAATSGLRVIPGGKEEADPKRWLN
jgi:hypothetical protein